AADARTRGLSRGRWGKVAYAVLGVTALGPGAVLGAAIAAAPHAHRTTSSKNDSPVGAAIGVAVIGWVLLMAMVSGYRAEGERPAGSAVAAKWLGLREHLHRDKVFPTLPPAAVAIWDRYLAYGAALGVAASSVQALPMGPEPDKEAWSPYGGRWR